MVDLIYKNSLKSREKLFGDLIAMILRLKSHFVIQIDIEKFQKVICQIKTERGQNTGSSPMQNYFIVTLHLAVLPPSTEVTMT